MKKSSLQDQLLNAGLTSKTKVSKVQSQKHKQLKKKRKNKVEVVDEVAILAKKTADERREKDKQLNEQRNLNAEKNQIAGQIKQLIILNKLDKSDEGGAYRFTHEGKVKSIYVADELRDRVVAGRAVIVQLGQAYEVVPKPVADKIAQRDKQRVIYIENAQTSPIDDDYADFEIPDDLMW
jgi:uncharacterized protein YaiL (DUF2058 family)